MKSHQNAILVLMVTAITFIATGCSTLPQKEIQSADYGTLPSNYKSQIKEHFASTLYDPYSAHYRFHNPTKCYGVDGMAGGFKHVFGHCVGVGVSYCQIWCMQKKLGGFPAEFSFVYSVDELHAVDELGELLEAA